MAWEMRIKPHEILNSWFQLHGTSLNTKFNVCFEIIHNYFNCTVFVTCVILNKIIANFSGCYELLLFVHNDCAAAYKAKKLR